MYLSSIYNHRLRPLLQWDDGEAVAKSEGYVAENGFVATDPTHFGKTYHDKLLLASNASQKEL